MSLRNDYDAAWMNSKQHLLSKEIFVDPLLSVLNNDTRLGLTVLIQLDGKIFEKFSEIIAELKIIEPHQYFYPMSDLHVTIIDLIGASENFVFDKEQVAQYKPVLHNVFQNVTRFPILFNGVCATRGAIFVQGFAGDFIKNMRYAIRQEITKAGLELQERVSGNFVHSCIARFKEPLKNPEKLVRFIEQSRELFLGEFDITSTSFVLHDWYNREEQTTVLDKYLLKTQ